MLQTDNRQDTDRRTAVAVPFLLLNCVDTRSSDTGLVIKSCCSSRRHWRLVSSLRPTSTNNTSNTSFSSSTLINCPRYHWLSVWLSTAHGWRTSQPSHNASASPVSTTNTHIPLSLSISMLNLYKLSSWPAHKSFWIITTVLAQCHASGHELQVHFGFRHYKDLVQVCFAFSASKFWFGSTSISNCSTHSSSVVTLAYH